MVRRLSGSGADDLGPIGHALILQAGHQIQRKEWGIGRHSDGERRIWIVRSDVIERGEHARERTRLTDDRVGDDRHSCRRETCRIAIGVDQEVVALRAEPGDDPFDDRCPADQQGSLVAAAHPRRPTACQHDPDHSRRPVFSPDDTTRQPQQAIRPNAGQHCAGSTADNRRCAAAVRATFLGGQPSNEAETSDSITFTQRCI